MSDMLNEPIPQAPLPTPTLPPELAALGESRGHEYWHSALANTGVAFIGAGAARLWHYTGLEALHGIVSDQALWMTNIRYTNDLSELEYGFVVFKEVLAAEREKYSAISPAYVAVLDAIVGEITRLGPIYDTYVCSLCDSGDLLPQWMTYGRSGGGVAIEFDTSRPLDYFEAWGELKVPSGESRTAPTPMGFRRVEYDVAKQRTAVSKLLEHHLETLNRLNVFATTHQAEQIRAVLHVVLRVNIEDLLYLLKHPSLSHEREWRLFAKLANFDTRLRPFFRFSNGYAVPYLKAKPKIAKLPITSVRVGKSAGENSTTRLNSAVMVLRAFGYPEIAPDWYLHVIRQ